MEDVIGLIVDAMAKRARGGAPAQPPKPPGAPKPPPRPTTAAPIRVVLPAQPPAQLSRPAQPSRPAAPVRAAAPDPFTVATPAPHPSPAGTSLLSAFTSRERLLAAIVLSEALGAPVALRKDNSFLSGDVLGPDAEN